MSELVVVDTNIIISALISGNENIIKTLSRPGVTFVSSNFAFIELFKHSPRIQDKSKLPSDELLNLLRIILDRVRWWTTL